MIIHFNVRFTSAFGQQLFISGNTKELGNNDAENKFPLAYSDHEFWSGSVETEKMGEISYSYILAEDDSTHTIEPGACRKIDLESLSSNEVIVIDTWNDPGSIENVFYTDAFREVLLEKPGKAPKVKEVKAFTHQFRVKAPLLASDEWVCITGSGKYLKDWDIKKLLPLKKDGPWFTIEINLAKEKFPLKYKYGIFNTVKKSFEYETGSDRILFNTGAKKQLTVLDDGFLHTRRQWKGAGLAIPVFSLRSKESFGVGEFTDIKLLTDWAKEAGLKLLQFLPVNDTTSSNTQSDSYPYSAISAFALHPLYINLEKVAGKQNLSAIRPILRKKKQLNALPVVNYEEVMKLKLSALRELFDLEKDSVFNSGDYHEFFTLNSHWLVPYAAFCFLRDKYKTADFSKWKTNKTYLESAVQKLVSSSQPQYEEIAFHYFMQYHLHIQLKEVSGYAHKNGIILKGDIPIGISRNSCDAWVAPSLYNMDEQAGAPPDDFAVKGQNWGFPTYNWENMQKDGFKWWRRRFEQMSNYFDAFRIDHILGFFRIWSIPKSAVEGILGRFVPAEPVHITEFDKNRIWFDHNRYCKPFITDDILLQYFPEDNTIVKEIFLDQAEDGSYELKEEFNTQKKIEKYIEQRAEYKHLKSGLMDLPGNIILIEEKDSQGQQFHFRIMVNKTSSFQALEVSTRDQLNDLYVDYFFRRQDELWRKEALQKLPELKRSTNMLVCGEDLGMVPHCVPDVMKQLGILSLEVQRMPKDPGTEFFHPKNAPYLSVVTPSTHDMSTIRGWWQEDRSKTQRFYNYCMGHYGQAPFFCEPWINKEIILQHLYSPAMWSIFQLQDLLGMSEKLRRDDPDEERINQPADPDHYWNYRMHISLEDLIKQKEFSRELATYIQQSGRS